MTTYRVGLLVDGTDQPGWIHDMAEWLARSQDFDFSALLVLEKATTGPAPRLSAKALFGTLSRLESRLLPVRQRQMLACHDMRDGLPPSTALLTLPADPDDGGRDDGVAALGLDLVIMLGGLPSLRARMADWARLGVWQLSYSDIAVSTSRYAGFWEVYQRADHTTVKLWRMGASAEEDALLDQRSFNTEVFWLKNQTRAFSLGNFMIYDALQALARARPGAAPPGMQIMSGERRDDPAEWDSAAYIARQAWLMGDLIVRRVMKRNVRWRIGMFPSTRQQAVISEAMVLQPPKGRFFADPFVYTKDKNPYIFFEDYDFNSRKGTISVATYADGAFRLLGTALNLPYHLSFPYIFEYDGVTYMVPANLRKSQHRIMEMHRFSVEMGVGLNPDDEYFRRRYHYFQARRILVAVNQYRSHGRPEPLRRIVRLFRRLAAVQPLDAARLQPHRAQPHAGPQRGNRCLAWRRGDPLRPVPRLLPLRQGRLAEPDRRAVAVHLRRDGW